jgi:sigma-B regulation protein RsbU (phosphoserine phosphatase)
MDGKVIDRIRQSLLEKRANLTEWLRVTPADKRQTLLGPATEVAVQAHLHTLDAALAKAASNTLGLCEVCHDYIETNHLEMDYMACVCIDHLSTKEIRYLENELELAQSVQMALLPQQMPQIPALEIAAFSRPAQIVGGDYFDFVQFRDGAHGLAIADVAGHGVSASLHMASGQTLLRTLVPSSDSPANVVRQMHEFYIHNTRFTTFVTMFIGAFDATSQILTYCNAGHNPPLVFRNGDGQRNSVYWLQPTGPAIGLIEETQFKEETIKLVPGDILVLYTDGVTEASDLQNEEFFGRERLATIIRQQSNLPSRELVKVVRQELEEFGNGKPLADDTTFVVCKIIERR